MVVAARLGMFSDSLTYFFNPKEDSHFIPLWMNYLMYGLSFLGMTEIPLCFGLLW